MKIILRKNSSWFLPFFFSCICCAIIPSVFAQTISKKLSLKDAIELSLKNSHQLHASHARILQASARLEQSKENQLPDASVSASYLRLGNPNIALNTGKPSGGSDSSTTKLPSAHQAMYGIANVSLPIFAGGKIKYGIESARFLQNAAVLDAANDSQSVVLNTIDAYANLYKANATVDVVKKNLAQSTYRDSVLLRLENNGLLARNDRLKAQLQTSNIELSLLDAENNSRIAMLNMNLMLGLPEKTALLTDSTSFQLPEAIIPLADMEQLIFTNRKDLLAMNERENAAHTAISIARGNYYPSIALTAGYIAAYVPKVLTITNAINAGIGVKYNLSSLWKTKSKISEATARLNELKANEASMQDAIRLQLNKSFENFLLQKKKISVYQGAVLQAEENYRISKNKFDNQLLNTTDLLDANVLLLQSEINLAVAKADLYLSYATVLQSAGILLK